MKKIQNQKWKLKNSDFETDRTKSTKEIKTEKKNQTKHKRKCWESWESKKP